MCIVTFVSLAVFLLSPSPLRVLPQSARWLLTKDRKEEAIALLRKAALVNGRVLPPAVQVLIVSSIICGRPLLNDVLDYTTYCLDYQQLIAQ